MSHGPSSDPSTSNVDGMPGLSLDVPKRDDKKVEMRIRVLRNRAEGNLGVDVAFDEEETFFAIEKLLPGPVLDWNKENPDMKVEVGDIVTEVNGISGNANMMVEACKNEEVLEWVVRRT